MTRYDAVPPELRAIQTELAAIDPCVLELDLENPDTALAMVWMARLLEDGMISVGGEAEDGTTETLTMGLMPGAPDSPPVISHVILSDSGRLSPGTLDGMAAILGQNLQAEIDGFAADEEGM
jgi:hypothetical protein